ncbi:SDR family oxidoreductase [Fervidobacterium pennivorans subsp. shakshaketiis]|jgi:3-oxoacyl-[acyl-carrier protein] reductase|uniref:SDR family NAD(P)-dependent oxidoreductase n=1 Tax=Fervidobacterium pennivorans TaxID=93466 RepID=UPI00355BA6F1
MKTVVVTGDSGGLGSAIVDKLLEDGYKVVGLSRRTTDEMIEKMKKAEGRYVHVNFDLSKTEEIKKLYSEVLKNQGPIYGLVNNAAYAYDDIVTNANLEELEKMFRINVFSPIILTKYIIRDMLLNDTKGSIVHISSVSAHTGYKGLSMYAATKGALEAFSRTVAREWGTKGIRSNCVAPGFMETPMSSTLSEDEKDRIYRRTSLKRPVEIKDVAEVVSFLLSEKSSSITGTTVHVDCGTI